MNGTVIVSESHHKVLIVVLIVLFLAALYFNFLPPPSISGAPAIREFTYQGHQYIIIELNGDRVFCEHVIECKRCQELQEGSK